MQERADGGRRDAAKRERVVGRADPGETRPRKSSWLKDHIARIGVAIGALAALIAGAVRWQTAPEPEAAMPPPEEPKEEEGILGVSWDLTVTDHDRVDFFRDFLMGRNRDKTELWLQRLGKYGPMIRKELNARGMPEDLVYLTMIESGFDPNAYSRAHAAGLWQFIGETGKRYGLEVSAYVDERRDPVKSTAAALTYLNEMHDRFGSWYLAAAGYNTGENRVARLMREHTGSERGTDQQYWDIWDSLPRETRDYVPLMLAAGHIAKEPGKYGFQGLAMQEPFEFEEVIVPGGTRLSQVARAANVDADTVDDLNPHLVKKITPPGRRIAVRVPVGHAETVAANLPGDTVVGESHLAD